MVGSNGKGGGVKGVEVVRVMGAGVLGVKGYGMVG